MEIIMIPVLEFCFGYYTKPHIRIDLTNFLAHSRFSINAYWIWTFICPTSYSSKTNPLSRAVPNLGSRYPQGVSNVVISCFIAAFAPWSKRGSKLDIFAGRGEIHTRSISFQGSDPWAGSLWDQGPETRNKRPKGQRLNKRIANMFCMFTCLCTVFPLIFAIALWRRYLFQLLFTDKEAAQRGKVICPRSHSQGSSRSKTCWVQTVCHQSELLNHLSQESQEGSLQILVEEWISKST